ncbi:MAG: DedA family protein [Gammaproteobacteria bacterium]|nr:DedA family protein [Gammaproteobacteria bacterium]MDH5692910.1 DedA family protein [Gammaproteobacteria bacterium]
MESGLVSDLLDWIRAHPNWAGMVIFLIAMSESLIVIGIAVPGVVFMIGVGALVGSGVLAYQSTVIWTFFGAIVGDGLSFWIGQRFHRHIESWWPFRQRRDLLPKAHVFFEKHGGKSVLFARFIGPLRAIVPAVAGMAEMSPPRFYLVNIISAAAWALVILLPGMVFGASLEMASAVMLRLISSMLLASTLLFLVFALIRVALPFLFPALLGKTALVKNGWSFGALLLIVSLPSFFLIQSGHVPVEMRVPSQATKKNRLDADFWWSGGLVAGESSPWFRSVQIKASEHTLRSLLLEAGWQESKPMTASNLLYNFSPDAGLRDLPIARSDNVLSFVYMGEGDGTRLALSLYAPSASFDDGEQFWLGTIRQQAPGHFLHLVYYAKDAVIEPSLDKSIPGMWGNMDSKQIEQTFLIKGAAK